MDRRERIDDPLVSTIAALEGWESQVWTALPAIVKSFNPAKMTIEAQPAIKARVRSRDENPPLPGAVFDRDTWWWVELPLLLDVPVNFPSGGGMLMTFPLEAGDEVTVVFMSRCLDGWWQSGGVQNQPDLRMHHLSDGIAFPGPRSVPKVVPNISLDSVQIRTDDGSTYVEVKDGIVNVHAAAVNLTNGGAVNKLVNELFKTTFDNHVHSGVSGGVGNTGAPTAAMPAGNLTTVTKAQ